MKRKQTPLEFLHNQWINHIFSQFTRQFPLLGLSQNKLIRVAARKKNIREIFPSLNENRGGEVRGDLPKGGVDFTECLMLMIIRFKRNCWYREVTNSVTSEHNGCHSGSFATLAIRRQLQCFLSKF